MDAVVENLFLGRSNIRICGTSIALWISVAAGMPYTSTLEPLQLVDMQNNRR